MNWRLVGVTLILSISSEVDLGEIIAVLLLAEVWPVSLLIIFGSVSGTTVYFFLLPSRIVSDSGTRIML